MTVSARDQRHFEAIRKAKDAERETRLREALARHPLESMSEGLQLGLAPVDLTSEALLQRRALDQAQLGKRGRALRMRGGLGGRRETAG